ncbi:MAG: dTDP-4-dehydrorhamnose reductase [Crocinitomicaceae bacterium]|nr:dTDP-4-dehydrorhamnose reductase [Crocinitomicaceae bacterium]
MKRVLVTGANGQLGLALQEAAKESKLEIVFMDKNSLDITNAKAIKEVFASQSFAICINAAAYTHVDGAEANKALAYAINATAVDTLAKVCKQQQCWLIHISTDYVFDGTLDRPYAPEDTPNPLNVYGASKLAGEQAVQAVGGNYSIVRTSWLYSHYGNNFYTKLLAQVNAGKKLRVTADQKGCPTRAEDLAGHLLTGVAEEKLETGISHYCGSEVMTWLDLARRLFPSQEVLEWGGYTSLVNRPEKTVL